MAADRTSILDSSKASVHFDSESDSDSDGPETVPLLQARKSAKEHEDAVASTLARRREEKRGKNRRRDEMLKAQVGQRRLREEEQAEVEDDEDEETEDEEDKEESDDEDGEEALDDDEEEGEDDEDDLQDPEADSDDGLDLLQVDSDGEDSEGSESADEEPTPEQSSKSPKTNPKHLPDHLFKTAFSQPQIIGQPSSKLTKRKAADSDEAAAPKRKHKRKNASQKDVSVGSRTFRTISQSSARGARQGASSGLLPPAKARKFVDRSLGLTAPVAPATGGGNAKPPNRSDRARSWQRRPANIGVMRPSIYGPASRFVRSG